MTIEPAKQSQSEAIAELIMLAMTHECCLHFVGENQNIHHFKEVMTMLVKRDDSQYSYKNTFVALHESEVVGIVVAYDGAKLKTLRNVFLQFALQYFNRDHSKMQDETQQGELYVDSLAVKPQFRGRGIATKLLQATIKKAHEQNIPAVGLLVDKGNPLAEKLYHKVGFRYVNDSEWGGHGMKHLQCNVVNKGV